MVRCHTITLENKKLRYLGNLQNGISKDASYFGSGFPFVSYGDVYNNIALPQDVDGLVESNATDRRIFSVKRGDVFFTRTSETIEEIGFSSTCLTDIKDATFAGFLIRFVLLMILWFLNIQSIISETAN